MKKQHIIPIVVLLIFAGCVAAAYQFYFKQKLEEYKEHEQTLDALKQKIKSLETTFAGQDGRPIKPEKFVASEEASIEPWYQAVLSRATIFKMPIEEVTVPDDQIPRFYYKEVWDPAIREITNFALSRGVQMPPNSSFDTPRPSELENKAVKKEEVQAWMRRIKIGSESVKFFVENGATAVNQIYIWPDIKQAGLLRRQVIGVEITMTMPKLVKLLEKIYLDERYINIEAIRIANPALRTQWDPPMSVYLLYSQADYMDASLSSKPVVAAAGPAGAAPAGKGPVWGGKLNKKTPEKKAAPKSWWQKLWPF